MQQLHAAVLLHDCSNTCTHSNLFVQQNWCINDAVMYAKPFCCNNYRHTHVQLIMRQIFTMQQKTCFMGLVSAKAASCSRSAANLEIQLDICCMNMCVSILGFPLISYDNNLLHHCCSSSTAYMDCTNNAAVYAEPKV